jgi:PiT family inorganic phosphate transporter
VKQKLITDPAAKKSVTELEGHLDKVTKLIPDFVKVAVALALGNGTMIGWKRIVVTVGEKIGKEHLTYAQGASAELVAMITIGSEEMYGLPVSTTHVLSSGIAGTLAAWVLTLPACVLLGAATFSAGLFVVFNVLGLK